MSCTATCIVPGSLNKTIVSDFSKKLDRLEHADLESKYILICKVYLFTRKVVLSRIVIGIV